MIALPHLFQHAPQLTRALLCLVAHLWASCRIRCATRNFWNNAARLGDTKRRYEDRLVLAGMLIVRWHCFWRTAEMLDLRALKAHVRCDLVVWRQHSKSFGVLTPLVDGSGDSGSTTYIGVYALARGSERPRVVDPGRRNSPPSGERGKYRSMLTCLRTRLYYIDAPYLRKRSIFSIYVSA